MAHVKGSAVKSSIVFLQEHLGEEGFKKLVSDLPEREAQAFSGPLLISDWYELSSLLTLMEVAEPRIDLPPGRTLAWEMGRFSAEFGIKTLYRIFFKVADVHFIIKRAPQIMVTYYDSGEMQVVKTGPKEASVRLVGFDQPSAALCDRLMGWMERVIELAGGTDVSMQHPRCMARYDKFCVYEASWK